MLDDQLVAVPLFVFMGIMMEQAGLMERLFTSVQLMFSRTRGSLYVAVLFVSTIFDAATGIVEASVTILGIMAGRTMNKTGYDVRLASGTITAGGTLGILVAVNLQTAWLSPPVALPAYFLKGVVPEWDLKEIFFGTMQFMMIQLIGLILIFSFPQIALRLPGYLRAIAAARCRTNLPDALALVCGRVHVGWAIVLPL